MESTRIDGRYVLVGPDGMQHEVKNVSQFCRKHNLDRGNLYRVILGMRRHHRGFTCPDAGYKRMYIRS